MVQKDGWRGGDGMTERGGELKRGPKENRRCSNLETQGVMVCGCVYFWCVSFCTRKSRYPNLSFDDVIPRLL